MCKGFCKKRSPFWNRQTDIENYLLNVQVAIDWYTHCFTQKENQEIKAWDWSRRSTIDWNEANTEKIRGDAVG